MSGTPTPQAGQPIVFRNGIVLTMDDSHTDHGMPGGDELLACLACTDLLTASRFVDEPGLSANRRAS